MSRCAECHQPFTPAEWADRHTRVDGEDVHAHHCVQCAAWARPNDPTNEETSHAC